jgi:phosphoribosyl 1,2-cyclic phosphodiesterase
VEVRCGDELITFDSGTGIRNLRMKLLGEMPIKGHIFYSHVHWDHIQGFPFFTPLYIPGNEFDIYGGISLPTPIEEVLNQQMTPPCFPVKMDILGAKINYHGIKPGNVIEGENFKVTLAPLYHPNGSYGYRIDYDGRSIVLRQIASIGRASCVRACLSYVRMRIY